MISQYLSAALRKARYEILPDDGSYYGEIPSFDGVYANAPFGPVRRSELVRALRSLGFDGPNSGSKHQFMVRGAGTRHLTGRIGR